MRFELSFLFVILPMIFSASSAFAVNFVGIGTTSPKSLLSVSGGNISLGVFSTQGASTAKYIGVAGATDTWGGGSGSSNVGFFTDADNASGHLEFATHHSGVSSGTRMTIDTDGNVGIGTTNPASAKLVVNAAAADAIQLQSTSNNNWRFGPNSGTGAGFGIYDDTAAATRLKIDLSGNVGIGMTNPSYALHVTGAAGLNWPSNTNQGLIMKATSATFAGSPIVFFNSVAGISGYIGQTTNSVSFNTTSDRRLKENILDTNVNLQDLLRIQVRDFNFIQDSEHKKVTGFIAQDLENIFPDAVQTNGGDGKSPLNPKDKPWSVDYGRITPLIVKAVQDFYQQWVSDSKELHSKIAAQKKEIDELKLIICQDHQGSDFCQSP